MQHSKFIFALFLTALSLFTIILFWQVFLKNQIPFSANLIASFFNPWAQEKFLGWEVGIPNKPTGEDDLWIFYPQRTLTNSILKNGEIPFWNPYNFAGNYHVGLSETAVFYPLNFLFLISSQINAWVFLIVIEPIIAGIGMFLFLSRITTHKKSAALGAFSFAFSGIVLVRSVEGLSVGHTLIWMPYVFWGIESFFQTKKIRYLYVILFPLILSLLAGWLQYTFYIFVFSVLYSIFKMYFDSKMKTKMYYLVCIPFLIFPFVTLFHTIPAFQALLESPRVALAGRVFSYQHLMPVAHIFTLIIPDFWGNPAVYNFVGKSGYKEAMLFIGVVPFIFSLFSIFTKENKKIIFFACSILVTLILAIDSILSKTIISSAVPIFTSFLPNRIFLITTFSFCTLAAFGFDFIIDGKKDAVWKTIRSSLSFLWIVMCVFSFFIVLRIIKDPSVLTKVDVAGINRSIEVIQFRNVVIPLFFLFITTTLLVVFKNKYAKNIFFLSVIIVLFFQSFLFAQKYIPFSYRQFVYPEHPVFSYLSKHQNLDRFMSVGSGHIVPSFPLQFFLYSPEGIGSMYIRRYGEFIDFMKFGEIRIPDKIAFDLKIDPQDVFHSQNERLHRFYELASVKYIVVDKKSMEKSRATPDSNDFSLVWENDKWQIYQYKKSTQRFFVTSNFEVIRKDKEILGSLFSKNFVPSKIILEENPGFVPSENTGSVKVINYSTNSISAKVNTNKKSLLYLSDTYSSMFKVFIDEKEGKVLRANYTFRAVPIPKGEHTVLITYDKKPFVVGFQIAIFTFSVLGLLTYFFRKYV